MPVYNRAPKYTKADVIAGTKHELEHTKDRKIARKTALDHLEKHPTYYRVLPMAEQFMSIQENKALPKPRRRRKAPARGPAGLPVWGQMPF